MATPSLPEKAALCQPADEKSVPPHLRCNSCSKPVFNSYQTPHGCRLCQTCVSTKLHPSEKRQCPGTTEACRDEEEEIMINQGSCLPDIATRREISKLTVTCPNKDDGCKEQLKWRDVDQHLEKCDYEKVSCEQCRDKILKKLLKIHLNDECPQRAVQCKLCSQMIVFSEIDKRHMNLESSTCCSKYVSTCPHCNDKGSKLSRVAFVDHLKICPDKPHDCKYTHLGCDKKARKSELEMHYKDDVDHHISLMDSKLRQLGTAAASGHTAVTASSVSSDNREIEEVKRKVTNIHDHFKKLQVNVANWAHLTLELEQMADKFGGMSQMRVFLKSLDEKIRQMDTRTEQNRTESDLTRRGRESINTESSVIQQRLNEVEFRLLSLENTSYEGSIVWKVSNLSKMRREALDGSCISIFSQSFFLRRNSFKFRVRLFLNGNESGIGTHVSVYLVLMQHEFDDIQDWPLKADVTFKLMNLKNRADDITKTVRFDSGNQRPSSREDLSVCCGDAKFVSINQLESSDRFVKNDCLFLEVNVMANNQSRLRRS